MLLTILVVRYLEGRDTPDLNHWRHSERLPYIHHISSTFHSYQLLEIIRLYLPDEYRLQSVYIYLYAKYPPKEVYQVQSSIVIKQLRRVFLSGPIFWSNRRRVLSTAYCTIPGIQRLHFDQAIIQCTVFLHSCSCISLSVTSNLSIKWKVVPPEEKFWIHIKPNK